MFLFSFLPPFFLFSFLSIRKGSSYGFFQNKINITKISQFIIQSCVFHIWTVEKAAFPLFYITYMVHIFSHILFSNRSLIHSNFFPLGPLLRIWRGSSFFSGGLCGVLSRPKWKPPGRPLANWRSYTYLLTYHLFSLHESLLVFCISLHKIF